MSSNSHLNDNQRIDAEDLKSRVDLREVVRDHWGTPDRTRRDNDVYFSRWRDDGRQPSFNVNAAFFKDFGGQGDGGDVYTFLQRERGIDFPEALAWLNHYVTGATEPIRPRPAARRSTTYSEPPAADWQQAARQWAERATAYLWSDKSDAKAALNWLRKRGLNDETIRTAGLGYNPYKKIMRLNDHVITLAQGITIPYEIDGVLWSIRVRTGNPKRKYLNMTGSRVTNTLYGEIVEEHPLVFVEGEFDQLLAQQVLGNACSVVTLGAASNRITVKWLKRVREASDIYLMMDADAAGDGQAADLLDKLGGAYVADLPDGQDVTDHVLAGGNLLTRLKYATWQQPTPAGRSIDLDAASDTPPASDDTSAAEKFQQRAAVRAKQLDRLYPTPDDTFSRPFVGRHPDGDVITDSPLGTGKTQAAAQDAKAVEQVLAVNDRVILTETLADALDAEHYGSFSGELSSYIASVARLVITVDSEHRIADATLPELLYVEEVDYDFRQFSAETMKNENRDNNASTLIKQIQGAGRVIATQANVSPVGVGILKSLRPGIQLVKNTYTPDRGEVSFAPEAPVVALDAVLTASAGGTAALMSDSRKQIQQIAYASRNEDYDLVVVHGHNSQDPAVLKQIREIEALVQKDRGGRGLLVLLSPSAAVGFNVSSVEFDLSATIGFNVVTPETYVQMNMRIRHAKRRRVYIPGVNNKDLLTDENAILDDLRATVAATRDLAEFSKYGVQTATEIQGWITLIDAAYTAWDNAQRLDMVGYTAAYFIREGFTPVLETDNDKKTIKQARAWQAGLRDGWKTYTEDTTRTEPAISGPEFDALRKQGQLREIHYFGRLRDKIEKAAGGRDINEHDIYERFDTGTKRRRMYRAEDLNRPRADLQALDRADVKRLPKYRRHYTAGYDGHMILWSALIGSEVTSTSEIYQVCGGRTFTEDDIERLRIAAVEYGFEQACKLIGYTCSLDPFSDNDRDRRRVGAGLFHALMRSIKLNADLDRSQPTVNGQRINVNSYTVADEVIEQAQEDLEYREKWREAFDRGDDAHKFSSQEVVDTQFVCNSASYNVISSDPPPDLPPDPPQHASGRPGRSKYNPFSV
jgi:hypothetical protein